jgi:alkylation response protein AidB-like acyl-CoA dehydrogenase
MTTTTDDRTTTLDTLAAEDAASEQQGCLTERAVAALVVAGALRAGVPPRWGGDGASFPAVADRLTVMGTAAGAASWVAALAYGSNAAGALLPRAGQQDLWGADPDAHVCGSFSPSGTARRAGDGYVVDAVVETVSGVHSAGWLMVMVLPTGDEDPAPVLAFVPLADVRVDRTWDAMGLRGTGSDRATVTGVTVPAHRVLALADFVAGMTAAGLPLTVFGPLLLAAPLVGLARGARLLAAAALGQPAGEAVSRAARPDVLAAYAELAMAVDRAQGLFDAAGADLGTPGHDPSEADQRAAVTLVIAAVQEAAHAGGLLQTVVGTRALMHAHRANRIWRDLQTGARHPLFAPATVRAQHIGEVTAERS